jgi:putative copper resistance protein D
VTEGLFIATRAIHFGAAMILLGELLFAFAIAGRRWNRAVAGAPEKGGDLVPHVQAVVITSLVASALSGAAWLAIEAASMTGGGVAEALDARTLATVLRETGFGRVWCVRAVVLAVFAAVWLVTRRRRADVAQRATNARHASYFILLFLAAVYAASLAFAGHAAAAMQRPLRAVHLSSDAVHVLAAGAWLGSLPALGYCLRSARPNAALARIAGRFSILGIASVAALLASGILNAYFLVDSVAALFGTPYGQLLLVKLVVFALMLATAAINRGRLTPRLADDDDTARSALHRNVLLEIGGGVAIVAIVGALGTMIPAAHQSPSWPLPFRLDPGNAQAGGRASVVLAASAAMAFAGVSLILAGMLRNKRWSVPGFVALAAAASASTWVLAAPAFPTTYATSPVPYTVDAVARGTERFALDCVSCHGAEGRGDGPAAATLANPPANLAEHASHHPPGNLYWWIAHGIPDTPMPAFAPKMPDKEIWSLVQLLSARSAADAAMSIGEHVGSAKVRVPDFAYELPQQGQRTLLGERSPALIVLYTLPASLPRLQALASDHALAHANLRVIAIALAKRGPSSMESPLQALTGADVAPVYATFARPRRGVLPEHAELLVDAAGFLRARWIGLPAGGSDRTGAIVSTVRALPKHTIPSEPTRHGH